jgi:hypothetical protein
VFNIKENRTSLPMGILSRQNPKIDKEVYHVHSTKNTENLCAILSTGAKKCHENFPGPLFSKDTKRWSLRKVLLQAVMMSYENSVTLRDRFDNTRRSLVEMFPREKRPGTTYQGFVKARHKIPSPFRESLQKHLQQEHRQAAGKYWRRNGWVAFAADGSRVEVPRTSSNQEVLKCAGKKKTGPQFQLTTIYHMSTGLPWDWRMGPGTEAERTHLRAMLCSLPAGSLLVADAGFTGYELFCELLQQDLSFLIRVGGNVTLLRDLGLEVERKGPQVWLWPTNKRDQMPLRLRLIRLKSKTRCKLSRHRRDVYLLTNVFDESRLSEEQASQFYRLRWGVEIFYRSFKQTLDQRKLRSRSPAQAYEELHWSLTALLLLGLMSVPSLVQKGIAPLRLSVAGALRMVRRAMFSYSFWRYRGDLRTRLVFALKDDYGRSGSKQSRDCPHKKSESPPGMPKIRPAKAEEILCAKRIYNVA